MTASSKDKTGLLIVTSFCDRPEREIFLRLARHMRVLIICHPSNPGLEQMRDAGLGVIPFDDGAGSPRDLSCIIAKAVSEHSINAVYAPRTETLAAAARALKESATKIIGYRGTTGHLSVVDIGPRLTYTNPRIDAIICVSEAVRTYLARKGISPEKLISIPKGHDPNWYAPADRDVITGLGIPRDAFIIGFAGRARRIKGVGYLVRALRHIPAEINPHLLLAGDIDDYVLKAMLRRNSVSRQVHCAGFREDAASLMGACDAFVMPSLKREGLPRALVEAMAQGVPSVATRVGGIPELVEDGVSGLLVPPRSASALARALTAIATDKAEANAMGARARERIDSCFHIDRTVDKMLPIFTG